MESDAARTIGTELAETLAEFVNSMNRGQYLLFAAALRQAGGELRIDPRAFAEAAARALPELKIDPSDGPVVLRLDE